MALQNKATTAAFAEAHMHWLSRSDASSGRVSFPLSDTA